MNVHALRREVLEVEVRGGRAGRLPAPDEAATPSTAAAAAGLRALPG